LVTGVALALTLLGGTGAVAAEQGSGGAQETAGRAVEVRVGTYNVCGHGCLPTKEECERVIGRDCATKLRPWAEGRAAAVAEDIDEAGLGVVATQEIGNNATPTQPAVDVESFRAPLTAALEARGYAEAPADYAGTRHPTQGYPLKSGAGRFTYYDASRYSHLDRRGRELPHDLLWLPDSTEIYGKTMTWNVLRERRSGARFVVVDMHLEYRKNGATDPNGWTKNWDEVRYADARRTAEELTLRNRHTRNLPLVFAGDMNSGTDAEGASAVDAFADVGFADAFAVADRRSGEEYKSYNGGKIPLPLGEKIDHLFVRNGTQVREWVQIPQTTETTGAPADLLRSDHNLSYATIRLAKGHR
jgi:endonuclease/exonuclease/phosphatase family metal-dependent hydrolase